MSRILVGTTSSTEKTLVESGRFYPPGLHTAEARLRYYASQFPVVEVDSLYYGLPSVRDASLWVERTAGGFVFDVKAFRLFTQHKTPPASTPIQSVGISGNRCGRPPRRSCHRPPTNGTTRISGLI
jgi:uncharacterized protein YecE (DUF72 family)